MNYLATDLLGVILYERGLIKINGFVGVVVFCLGCLVFITTKWTYIALTEQQLQLQFYFMLPILGIISGFFNAFFTFLTGVVGHYRLVVFWCQNAWVFSQKCMSFSPEPMICFPKHSGMIRHWSKPKRFHYVERTLSNSFAILLFSSMEII